MTPRRLFAGTRWIWTLLVCGLVAAQGYLALWQWDRYQLRRQEETLMRRQLARETVVLPLAEAQSAGLAVDDLRFRKATVQGAYDFPRQFLWVGPKDRMQTKLNLVTPMVLPSGDAILVDRGLVSARPDQPATWRRFDDPAERTVSGILLPSAALPDPEFLARQARPVLFWAKLDLPAIQAQLPYTLLPVYLHQEPEPGQGDETEPLRLWYTLRTPAGMHLSYAVQWIMSALILGFLYVMIIRFMERRARYRAAGIAAGDQGRPPFPHRTEDAESHG